MVMEQQDGRVAAPPEVGIAGYRVLLGVFALVATWVDPKVGGRFNLDRESLIALSSYLAYALGAWVALWKGWITPESETSLPCQMLWLICTPLKPSKVNAWLRVGTSISPSAANITSTLLSAFMRYLLHRVGEGRTGSNRPHRRGSAGREGMRFRVSGATG